MLLFVAFLKDYLICYSLTKVQIVFSLKRGMYQLLVPKASGLNAVRIRCIDTILRLRDKAYARLPEKMGSTSNVVHCQQLIRVLM